MILNYIYFELIKWSLNDCFQFSFIIQFICRKKSYILLVLINKLLEHLR
jgi:hypothetical protein